MRKKSLLLLALAACSDGPGDPAAADASPPADAAGPPDAEGCFAPGATSGSRVHVVYLVPADRAERPEVTATLDKTIRELRHWYRDHTPGGETYRLNEPVVDVIATPHEAAFYATNDSGSDPYLWFWDNVLADGFALTEGAFFDPSHVWLYYIDADNACGQIGGGGTSGVAVLPANDIRGLMDEPRIPSCTTDPPDTFGRCRWVGGLGHELGHAFGLPHPAACEDGDPGTPCPDGALMWLGYTTYPDAFLTEQDLSILEDGTFFSAQPGLPDCALDCAQP